MATTVETDDADVWSRSITENFITLTSIPTGARFHGALHAAALGEGVTISRVSSSPAVVRRTLRGTTSDSCDDVLLLTPVSGTVAVSQNDTRVSVRPGMVSVHVAEQPYELAFDAAGEVLVMQAPRAFAPAAALTARVRLAAATHPRPLVSVLGAFLNETLAVSDRLTASDASPLRQTAQSLALALLSAGAAEHRPDDHTALALRAQAYVRGHHDDPDLTPARVAARFRVSVRSLQAAFRAVDASPAEYIRTVRLTQARRLVTDVTARRLNIASIAASVGYDEGTFYRAYRRRFGCTPGEDRMAALAATAQ